MSPLPRLLTLLVSLQRAALSRHLPSDVSPGDVRMLEAIGTKEVTKKKLGEILGLSETATHVAVFRLLKRGLVRKVLPDSAETLHAYAYACTPAGKDILKVARRARDEWVEKALAPLPARERKTFERIAGFLVGDDVNE